MTGRPIKIPTGLLRGALCLAAGGLTVLAFSPFDLYFMPFITLALLFRVWRGNGGRAAFINGYLFGLGLFGFGVSWLHISIHLFAGVNLVGAWALTFLLVAWLSLFPALVGYLGSCRPARSDLRYFLVIAPCLWALSEWARAGLLTGFPWLTLGYAQTGSVLSGYAGLVGVFGVSLISAFLAGVCALLVTPHGRKPLILAFLATLVISWLCQQHAWTDNINRDIKVALVQAAIPQELKWLPERRRESMERYLAMTQPFQDHDLIVWPETAVPAYLHAVEDSINAIDETMQDHGSILLTGLLSKDPTDARPYNSLLLLGGQRQLYNKRKLVPFGEYLPLKPLLGGVVAALGIPMSDFSPGARNAPPILHTDRLSIGVSICYEAIFGNEVRQAVPAANVLVNVSNDAWFGDSISPHQHLQMARMRAIETGRYLLRATNTGISAIIDEKGRVVGKTQQFKPDAVATSIALFAGGTPYGLTGDAPVITFALLALAQPLLRRRARRKPD